MENHRSLWFLLLVLYACGSSFSSEDDGSHFTKLLNELNNDVVGRDAEGLYYLRSVDSFARHEEDEAILSEEDKALVLEVQENIEQFVTEGFERAVNILSSQNTGTLRDEGVSSCSKSMMDFHSRKTGKSAYHAYSCKGLGMLETSKLVAEHYGISPEKVSRILKEIEISNAKCQAFNNECGLGDRSSVWKQIQCSSTSIYRTIDGTCNNIQKPFQGAANTPFKRFLPPAYDDGVNSPRGSSTGRLPNPRKVSAGLAAALPNPRSFDFITQMVKAFGQLLDHDMVLTPETTGANGTQVQCCVNGTVQSGASPDCLPIDVSTDPFYQNFGVQCLRFVRSLACGSASCQLGPREQINQVTSYIDASNVYGSSATKAAQVRRGTSRYLKINTKMEGGSCPASGACPLAFLPPNVPDNKTNEFIAGDVRVNEQPGLTTLHTLFLRYHNKIADVLKQVNSGWTEERLYQETRRIVAAMMQHITYNEFLSLILGSVVMNYFGLYPVQGYIFNYSPTLDASHASVFSTAAFRFGHSLIGNNLLGQGSTLLPLRSNFFNPQIVTTPTFYPSHLARGETILPSEDLDIRLVDSVINFLFAEGPAFSHGSDLMALNIMRGRDHGIPSYNKWRQFCGLRPFADFNEMANSGLISPDAWPVFQRLYSSVNDIDLFPAALAERKVPNSIFGDTFACILGREFRNLKFGDRFWYENGGTPQSFTPGQLTAIKSQTLASVICDTTPTTQIQKWVMVSSRVSGNPLIACSTIKSQSLSNPTVLSAWKIP